MTSPGAGRFGKRESEREKETWRLKSANHTYHRRVETPGARTHVFHTCSTILPSSLSTLSPDRQKTRKTCPSPGASSTRMVDASPYATIRSGQCSVIARFKTWEDGWGGFFVCRRTRFPQKRCSVWWKPFLFARVRPQNHFLFLFGSKTRLSREKEREGKKERASLRAARTKSFLFSFQIVLPRDRV